MDMTMSSIRPNRVEVVTSVQCRRRWSPEQKLEIVKQTNEPGSSVPLVACQHRLRPEKLIDAFNRNLDISGRPAWKSFREVTQKNGRMHFVEKFSKQLVQINLLI
jgi:hypothetical protein